MGLSSLPKEESAVISTSKARGPLGGGRLSVLGPKLPTPVLEVPRGHSAGTGVYVAPVATRPSPALQAYATVTVKPSSPTRLLKVGAVVLISGALLMLFGAIGAFYFWKGNDNHVSPTSGLKGYPPKLGCKGRQVRGVAGPPRWSQSSSPSVRTVCSSPLVL